MAWSFLMASISLGFCAPLHETSVYSNITKSCKALLSQASISRAQSRLTFANALQCSLHPVEDCTAVLTIKLEHISISITICGLQAYCGKRLAKSKVSIPFEGSGFWLVHRSLSILTVLIQDLSIEHQSWRISWRYCQQPPGLISQLCQWRDRISFALWSC